MRVSSRKSKGRRACQKVASLILETFPQLSSKDVFVTPSGVTGVDIQLSQRAYDLFPFCVEVKNQESLNVWAAHTQAASHQKEQETPLLFFTRNRSPLYVSMLAEDFFKLLCQKNK